MRISLLVLTFFFALAGPADARKKRRAPVAEDTGPKWHELTTPLDGHPEVVGSYAGGCIVGAVPVAEQGIGYETIRRWRNRFYAHPQLASWLEDFGRRIRAAGLPDMLIGDMSQPRGGRMHNGHRSHQVGLDADIWFSQPPVDQRDSDGHFPSLVNSAREVINRSVYAKSHIDVLKLAAAAPEVERIFVNWVIKKELCKLPVAERAWLHKIRPWYGHDSHFHVRLRCPADSPFCRGQSRLPPGDGCGDEAWFSRAAGVERRKQGKAAKLATGKRGAPPIHNDASRARCAEVLAAAAHPGATVAAQRAGASPGPAGHGGDGRPAVANPK